MNTALFKRFILLLIFFISAIYADDEKSIPIENIDGGISSIINGCVSAISGDYLESETDIVVAGPEPLVFQRFYASSDYSRGCLYNGWRHNHNSAAFVNRPLLYRRGTTGRFLEPSGRCAYYTYDSDFTLRTEDRIGVTNCGAGPISARTNGLNTEIHFLDNDPEIEVHTGDGTKRFFNHKEGTIYIKKERKANGNKIYYTYTEENQVLDRIRMTNQMKNCEYSWIQTSDIPRKKFKQRPKVEITSSDKQKVIYKLAKFHPTPKDRKRDIKGEYYIVEVDRSHGIKQQYEYEKASGRFAEQIIKKINPDNRFLQIAYYRPGDKLVSTDRIGIDEDNYRINRVKTLSAPVGTDSTPIVTHRFEYKKLYDNERYFLGGNTTVYDAYMHKTLYEYDSYRRLDCIKKYTGDKDYKVHSTESYVWSPQGNLLCTINKNAKGIIKKARHLIYDKIGNVIEKREYGNYSGEKKQIGLDATGLPLSNWSEANITKYTYSNDKLHLLTSQIEANGKKTVFTYVPDKDLIASKLVYEKNKIKIREFFEYDQNNTVIKKIKDDGTTNDKTDLTGVTERFITYTQPKKTAPIGYPETVEEKYLDLKTKKEKLLRTVITKYSIQGHPYKARYYDHTGTLIYTLSWKHDRFGNVIEETNALNQTIHKEYDANNNLIYECGPNPLRSKSYQYDFSNRLIATTETLPDGTELVNSHKYDFLGNCISTIDENGNETQFEYNEFGQITKFIYPPCIDENGEKKSSTVQCLYDSFGKVAHHINQKQGKTVTYNNVLGKPLRIEYPDGTTESNEYNIDGTPLKKVEKNGSYTVYKHDVFGRILEEKAFDANGELQGCITSKYNSFHLISQTDAEGKVTHYKYDGAGRNIAIHNGDGLTTHEYDNLGRICKTCEWADQNPDNCIFKFQEYDLLNRVVSVRTEDAKATILQKMSFEYDADGNKCLETIHTSNGMSQTYTEYHNKNQPSKIIDPEGNVTLISYEYASINDFGMPCLKITHQDPLGIQTITTFNALNKENSVVKKNTLGEIFSKSELFYDLTGNCSCIKEYVITPNAPEKVIITKWEYDSCDNLVELTEAVGTFEQRKTHFQYNTFGQKQAIIKPNGISIEYTYTSKGLLKSLKSSDGSCHYEFEYNRNDLPIKTKDLVKNTETTRSFNQNNLLAQETLANNLTMKYAYDRLGKVVHFDLPDCSAVDYTYHATQLKEIHRISSTGEKVYSHHNEAFDLSGHLTTSQLLAKAGKVHFTRDSIQRLTNVSHPSWSQNIPKGGYDSVGNITQYELQDLSGYNTCHFSYDAHNHINNERGMFEHTYQYDSVDNRIQKDDSPYTINSLNQLLHESNVDYTYDACGNLIQETSGDKTLHYTYDALDRLIEVSKDNERYVYTYDADNRRLSKESYLGAFKQSEQKYLYQGQNEIGVYDSDQLQELRILRNSANAEIGSAIAIELRGQIYAPIHDISGNVSCLLDMEGKPQESYRYSAFGEEEIFNAAGEKIESTALGNSWRFSSKRVDPETGLVYFGRRYYNPRVGRWTVPDPLGLTEGPNLYTYVCNNPLTNIDLYGLWGLDSITFGVTSLYNATDNFYFGRDPLSHEVWSDHNIYESVVGNQSQIFSVGDIDKDYGIGFVNGMLNGLDEAKKTGQYFSDLSGGSRISCVHNDSAGPFDMIECIFGRFYIATEPVRLLHQQWDERLKNNPDATFLQFCHSQGAIHVRNALMSYPKELRDRIFVVAIAPGAYIPHGLCKQVIHYRVEAYRDIVPLTDLWGMIEAWDTTVVLTSLPGEPFQNHSVRNKTYADRIQEHCNNYISTYGKKI
jgi:RHS repeat-associated protein